VSEDIQTGRPLYALFLQPREFAARRVQEQVKTVGDKTKGVVAIAQEL